MCVVKGGTKKHQKRKDSFSGVFIPLENNNFNNNNNITEGNI